MKNALLFTLALTCNFLLAQTNDSPITAYTWKGKKTVPHNGYVVLKSGKKLNGQISLIGSISAVSQVSYVGDGKDIKFPVAALQSYGLVSTTGQVIQAKKVTLPPNTKDLFKWRTGNEANGNIHENTKPRSGYIILASGSRIDGEIQLKRLNGHLTEIKLKTSDKKYKFEPNELEDYGLILTIAELTKNGQKTYRDDAKNFNPGKVTLKDGTVMTGLVAFSDKHSTSVGTTYGNVMYAKNQNAIIKTFDDTKVSSITQSSDKGDVKYTPFEGGFVSTTEMSDANYNNVFKMLNPGTVTLKDGTKLIGKVAELNDHKVNYQDVSGTFKSITSDKIKRIDIQASGQSKALINVKDYLVEELYKGKTFQAYFNPTPTHVDKFATGMTKGALSEGGNIAGAAKAEHTDKKNHLKSNVDSVIANSSTKKLIEINNDLYKTYGVTNHNDFQESKAPDAIKSYESSISIAIAGRQASKQVVVYYKECVIVNKKTNKKTIVYNGKGGDDDLKALLMGCYTFLSLDKSQQKDCYKLKNIKETLKMIDACY